jgi:hypothetical protein
MNRVITFLTVMMFVFGVQTVFSQSDLPEPVLLESPALEQAEVVFVPGFWFADNMYDVSYLWAFNPGDASEALDFSAIATLAAAASSDASSAIPNSLRNNKYYVESVRLTNLAQESFEYGDYDASSEYAAEALKYAQLSDEYVALQLKIKAANDAIAAARSRLDWADSIGAAGVYPTEYGRARTAYNEAVSFRSAEEWDQAIAAAQRVIDALAYVRAPSATPALPAKYTVRPWAVSKDCLWNIAGRPWAYGDSTKWKLIYEANKANMPEPDNPDLIHPGMILDIPSIRGETRQGVWDEKTSYTPLK